MLHGSKPHLEPLTSVGDCNGPGCERPGLIWRRGVKNRREDPSILCFPSGRSPNIDTNLSVRRPKKLTDRDGVGGTLVRLSCKRLKRRVCKRFGTRSRRIALDNVEPSPCSQTNGVLEQR